MASSQIQLIFEAIDRTSATVNKIDTGIKGLSASSSALGSVLSGVFTGAGIAAFNTAINVASSAVNGFFSEVAEGAERQQDLISSAGGLALAIGKPFDEAKDYLNELNEAVTDATKKLPGSNELFQGLASGLADNLVPAVKELNGAINLSRLSSLSIEFSKLYGVLGGLQGVNATETIDTLQKALSGSASLAELGDRELFAGGTGARVLASIREQVVASGVQQLSQLSEQARIEIIQKAAQLNISDEQIKAAERSLSGIWEGIQTDLDEFTNFAKALSSRNDLTVVDAAGDVLNSIYDLFNKISSSFANAFGLTDTSLLEFVFDSLKSLAAYIDTIAASIDPQALTGFFSKIADIFNAIGDLVGGDNLAAANDILSGGFDIGQKIGGAIREWVNSIDWANVLIDLGQITIAVVNFVAGFVAGLNSEMAQMWADLLSSILETLYRGFQGIIQSTGELINSWVSQVVSEVSKFGTNLISKINEIWNALINAVGNAIESAKSAVQNALSNIGGTILNTITGGGGTGGSAKLEDAGATYSSYKSGGSTNSMALNVGTININTPNGDSTMIAKDIVRALDQEWKQYRGNWIVDAV